LALEQACAYIKNLRCPFSDYVESYEKQSLQLLNKQKASSPCVETSQKRLAVHTTWLLNFEYIRKNENGIIAIRFLNASAFMNPSEIQKELINVGEPRVDDKAYCNHVSSSLGSLEILKLLTDFSLFKEIHNSSLAVHRLVQEIIQENLKSEEKVESIVNAARLLRFALSNCPSPDELLVSVVSELNDRPSLHSTDSSRFYTWHKMCLHAYEIKTNIEKFLKIFRDVEENRVFLPEVARIVYECALYLNVNNYTSQAKAVSDFANRILDWGDDEISEERLKALFPHMLPLSESLRRHIQYSCKAPLNTNNPTTSNTSSNDSIKSQLEKMRLEGNKLFKEKHFKEAITIYSSCIDSSKGTDSFDPKLLTNRASAYLRSDQHSDALKDAEEYIKYSPECWRGYARKALALHGLNEKEHAECYAALTFYHHPDVFDKYDPFKNPFSKLNKSIPVCNDVSSLVSLLSQLRSGNISDMPRKIIVLKPGKYCLSAECFGRSRVVQDTMLHMKRLCLSNVCLVGGDDHSSEHGVALSFCGNFGLRSHNFMAVNISFIFDLGNWLAPSESVVKLCKCSFTSDIDESAFVSEGSLSVMKCQFTNCKSTALCIAHGNANVEESVFSGNECIGLEVVAFGNLVLKNSKLHGNQWGLDMKYGTSTVTGCQIYDNRKIGVSITNGKAKLTRNEIFHNDRHGIGVTKNSYIEIEENEVFENGWIGIQGNDSCCRVSRNKIYQNKCGGIHIEPITKASGQEPSVIEFNKIFSNEGPGIDETFTYDDKIGAFSAPRDRPSNRSCLKAKRHKNELKDNVETGSDPPQHNISHICFSCHKDGKLAKSCTRCFTAAYCNSECEKSDLEKHKINCARLLEKYSVLVKILPLSSCLIGDKQTSVGPEYKAPFPWLKPSGKKYAAAPKRGKGFIVKIQAGDGWRKSNEGGTLLAIEDRSLTINGNLDMHEHSGRIYHLVRECGSNCESYGWKKMFFRALLAEDKKVRVFISDFPKYQHW
jgi:tetratricopeptide (TPR) repeat protein